MDAATGCPDNYTELFEHYWPMMMNTVSHAGIAKEDVEDVTMEILTKFMEKDGLAHYDPDYVVDTGPTPDVPGPRFRPAKFSSMLRGFTSTYVMAFRDKQKARHERESVRLDAQMRPDEATEFIEFLGVSEPQVEVDFRAAVSYSLTKTASQLRACSTPHRDYPTFCSRLVTEVYETYRLPKRDAMCTVMGVSSTTLRAMLSEYRQTLADVIKSADVYS